MKKVFLSVMVAANFLALSAQDVLLFDFSTKLPTGNWPWTAWGGISMNVVDDASSLGNKVVQIKFNEDKKSGPGITMNTAEKISTDDYAGFTIKVKSDIPATPGLIFTFVLERTDGAGTKGNWSTFPKYQGNGGWEIMQFPFLASQKGFSFDRIALNLTTHGTTIPANSLVYLDDVTLVTSFSTGTDNVKADNYSIFSENGIVSVQGISGNTDVKIYTALGSLVYNARQNANFSVDLREYGVSSGILFVNINDGIVQKTRKVLYTK
jgi:hypothetical protein